MRICWIIFSVSFVSGSKAVHAFAANQMQRNEVNIEINNMSSVTNLIIHFSSSEDSIEIINEINKYKVRGNTLDIVSMDDKKLPVKWYGGTKMMEAQLLIGAYNYLDIEGLILFLKRIKWQHPEDVQIIYKTQDNFKFILKDLFQN